MTGCKQRGPGRPMGEVSQAILRTIKFNGPMTAREIAYRTQLTVETVKFTCNRLTASGYIEVVDRVRQPGVNRPVGRYAVVSKSGAISPITAEHLWSRQ